MASSDRADVYARVTAQIIAAIEAGAGEYRMPWHGSDPSIARPINVASGKAYRGVNRLALWIAAQSACYPSGVWGTYRHWQALGAQVRKGERATTVVFWKEVGSARSEDDSEDESERRRFLARGYSVFNQAQVDNYEADAPALLPEAERIVHADLFYAHLGINTVYGGSEAYFLPSCDRIHMPVFEAFQD
jgi:antirestriction protein ArdC